MYNKYINGKEVNQYEICKWRRKKKIFLRDNEWYKKKEKELKDMKNKLSENEFYKKIEILKDAKLRARRAFMNGVA